MRRGSGVVKIQSRNFKTGYGDKKAWDKLSKEAREANGKVCGKCGRPGTRLNPVEAHHVVPVTRGGKNCLANLVNRCRNCHNLEHGRLR